VRVVTRSGDGGPEVLGWGEAPEPTAGPGEVVLDVAASAVNRADLLQRMGFYPPPPGASDVLGLECSGRVRALGPGVTGLRVGDPVCALLAGGGYAERVAVPALTCLPVPAGVDLVTAAALPEVACTVWSNVVLVGRLAAGEAFLVHGGGSGIGTMAIQVAAALGAREVACTVGGPAKADRCRDLGATVVVDHTSEDFVEVVRTATGSGADVVLDIIGAAYLARNVDVLAPDGRLVVIGLQGGTTGEVDLNALLRKRGSLHATNLRGRPLEQKAEICAAVTTGLWPLVADGRVRPVVGATFPMSEAADAHRLVESSTHFGKVLLVGPAASA
jgi:putative PIG3 family NAD(P)H quinone oxidoreductase